MPKKGGALKAAKAMCKEAIKGSETTADREDHVKSVFAAWDKDGSGFITKEELVEAMIAIGLPKKSAEALLEEMDADHDEQISYDELVSFLFRAPNLEKYFEKLRSINTKKLQDAEAIHIKYKEKFGPKMLALEAKCQKLFDKQLTPLLKKSFAFHDKDSSGILEVDEGIIFFSNFASMLVESSLDCTANTTAQQMKWIGCIDWSNLMAVFQEDETALLEKLVHVIQSETRALMESYVENQDERHRAAYKVLDVSGDGNLQEEEIIRALVPGHEKNAEFMHALGLTVSRDRILAAAREGRA